MSAILSLVGHIQLTKASPQERLETISSSRLMKGTFLLSFKGVTIQSARSETKKVQVSGCCSWRRCRTGRTRYDVPVETLRGYLVSLYSKKFIFQRHGNRLPLDPKRTQWLMLGRQAPPRNLAIRLISSHSTASASTFLLDEWPILNFVFEVDFFLSSKREAFFVFSLKAHPSLKLTNNVLGYVLTEQFPNGSGPDQYVVPIRYPPADQNA